LLYQSSHSFKQNSYSNIADEIGTAIALKLVELPIGAMKLNSHFCHGTAGVALFLSQLYRFTGHGIYQQAANIWLTDTMTHLEADLNHTDFISKQNSLGLLEGVSGAMFALAAAANEDIATNWTDIFLLPQI
jgi:lantibiotic modifying enzyme